MLKKYKEIQDIIIFGSFVKSKFNPRDIDIALITSNKDLAFIGKIKSQLYNKVHLEVINPSDLYTNKLLISIISEGFSIKKNRFLKDINNINPMKIYRYYLKDMSRSQKAQFNRALHFILKKIKGNVISPSSVAVPIKFSGEFEDFLRLWNRNRKTEVMDIFLLKKYVF